MPTVPSSSATPAAMPNIAMVKVVRAIESATSCSSVHTAETASSAGTARAGRATGTAISCKTTETWSATLGEKDAAAAGSAGQWG